MHRSDWIALLGIRLVTAILRYHFAGFQMNFKSKPGPTNRYALGLPVFLSVCSAPLFVVAAVTTPAPQLNADVPLARIRTVLAGESRNVPEPAAAAGVSSSLAIADASEKREVAFVAENTVAMQSMMTAMAVEPTGDIDRDFVEMMVPHHQGAIDMATVLLRYSSNERLKRLAQEIIVTQQEEIVAMRLAVGETLPPATASPTQPSQAGTQ